MSVTSQYRDAWEGFWSEATEEPGAVFWDAEPALTAGMHLARYEPLVDDAGLTMLDLGCGNGTQTRFLADRFPKVMGVDLSAAAIDLAHRQQALNPGKHPTGELVFRRFDAVDEELVALLHAEVGDCNVYMRGVLHQTDPPDRQRLVDSIAVLVGERGRAFVVDLAEAAGAKLGQLAQLPSGPPPKLQPVFRHGLVPGAVTDEEVAEYFTAAGLTVLISGDLPLTTTEYEADGSRIQLPSKWVVIGRGA
ncbi:class I SAM-dependent methyltransferase [Streptomyces albipurpureus]|uniref:Class I SAM-dependent methyltransferase n=1 Tax=Streptomyces albipurpureus TaxID=2897419 RepID=A0ABT0UF13_9ACTN|nr:class I SAM-dependent methyltransferase [Streptomyces sp. CWNU-1]MCM2386939.1 class I SAM-dependent methyltransferase [Streptomyces sp. CWNU-1]